MGFDSAQPAILVQRWALLTQRDANGSAQPAILVQRYEHDLVSVHDDRGLSGVEARRTLTHINHRGLSEVEVRLIFTTIEG